MGEPVGLSQTSTTSNPPISAATKPAAKADGEKDDHEKKSKKPKGCEPLSALPPSSSKDEDPNCGGGRVLRQNIPSRQPKVSKNGSAAPTQRPANAVKSRKKAGWFPLNCECLYIIGRWLLGLHSQMDMQKQNNRWQSKAWKRVSLPSSCSRQFRQRTTQVSVCVQL